MIISVDSGGTKTKVCAIDDDINSKDYAKIIETSIVGPGSPAVVGEVAFENIDKGISNVLANHNFNITCISMGVSGLGAVMDRKNEYIKRFEDKYYTKVIMENDATLALYSIIKDEYNEGVLVLSGTGSAVIGIKNDILKMYGGWGHLFYIERGSPFAIVMHLICMIINKYEDTGIVSSMGKKMMDYFGYKDIQDFKYLIYQHNKGEVSAHAKFIDEEALKGDEEAIEVLKRSAHDLVRDVKNCFKGLNLSSDAIIGLRGGFIHQSKIMQDELIKCLKGYNLTMEYTDPVYGGFYMAKRKMKC